MRKVQQHHGIEAATQGDRNAGWGELRKQAVEGLPETLAKTHSSRGVVSLNLP
jgi:hypothetical protein